MTSAMRFLGSAFALVGLTMTAACPRPVAIDEDLAGEGEGEFAIGEGEGEGEGEPVGDPHAPFRAQPDTSEGLTNTSANLEALLEGGALPGACAAWEADPTDRRKKLLCGKSMFFYEGFGTIGVPTALYDFFGTDARGDTAPCGGLASGAGVPPGTV